LRAASTALRPLLLLPRASSTLSAPPTFACEFDACGTDAVAETLSFDTDDSESTDPDEKSELLVALPLETAFTVSLSLPLRPLCAAVLELTAAAPLPGIARDITGELEPLIQTIPDPVLGPPGLIPDPDVPEVVAG